MRHWGVVRLGAQYVNWNSMNFLKLIHVEIVVHPEAAGVPLGFFLRASYHHRKSNLPNKCSIHIVLCELLALILLSLGCPMFSGNVNSDNSFRKRS